MNPFDFSTPAPASHHSPRLAQLTRHLSARLGEFYALTITQADQTTGTLTIRHQDGPKATQALGQNLASHFQVITHSQGDGLTFYLQARHQFEDIDRLWGCFFGLMG